jgi:hypothetical protein
LGIFLVCTQVIMHFRPNKDYEKYLRMLVGAMVLLQIFIPVVRLFSGNGVSNLEGSISGFAREMEESRKEAEAAGIAADRILERMTLDQVRDALAQQGIGQEGTIKEGTVKEGEVQEGEVQKGEVQKGVEIGEPAQEGVGIGSEAVLVDSDGAKEETEGIGIESIGEIQVSVESE